MTPFYSIGRPGQPWGDSEKLTWRETQAPQRSYRDEVLSALEGLHRSFEVFQYGALSADPERYPLMGVKHVAGPDAPWAMVTGGVHGYETSGVQGALRFLRGNASAYQGRVNLLVLPCVSPWGYETIQRWNPLAVDPNRSFVADGASEEAAAVMQLLRRLDARFLLHMDLHETTDSDEAEFRPALAARDGQEFQPGSVPDGFYTVGDTHNPQLDFQAAIIAGAETVTHIAPADAAGRIIGSDVLQRGVILYPFAELGLCAGVTGARLTTTTEVYPDSAKATPSGCAEAQVAAVCAGLEFALSA